MNEIVKYTYDAWGNHNIKFVNSNGDLVDFDTNITYNTNIETNLYVALKNPFRYRSYYYDTETKLYYLNSRYYDPEIGRFINIDDISVLSETQNTFNGLNLFAYCHNNPVSRDDEYGYFFWFFIIAIVVGAAVGGTVNTVQAYQQGARGFKNLFGAFLGGAIMGAGMGAITALGGVVAAGAIGGIGFGAGLALSAGIGLGSGLIAYSAEVAIRDDVQWNLKDFSKAGLSGMLQGALSFGVGFIGGNYGAYDATFLRSFLKDAVTLNKNITYALAKSLIGRTMFLTPLSEFFFKTVIIGGFASFVRSIVKKAFD